MAHRSESAPHDLGAVGVFFDRRGEEFLEVQPRAESARSARCQHDAANGAVGGESIEKIGNFGVKGQGQGIGGRAVDLDRHNLAGSFHHEGHSKLQFNYQKVIKSVKEI